MERRVASGEKVRGVSSAYQSGFELRMAVRRCRAVLRSNKILQLTCSEIVWSCFARKRLSQAGQRFVDVHRKQPLPNHGQEKTGRRRPDRAIFVSICAAHGGRFAREYARK